MRFILDKELTERLGCKTIETDLRWYVGDKAKLKVDRKEIERKVYWGSELYIWLNGYKVFYSDIWKGEREND